MPAVSILLVGIIYGGITFYDYVELANAVSVGARTLATNRNPRTGGTTGQTACVLEEAALKTAAANLDTSKITITETFGAPTGTTTPTCTNLVMAGDTATVNATYPCSLYFQNLGIHLCPVAKGNITSNGTTIGNCPYAYCISSTTTVSIE
jgi:Flp pilus assembly protein TadG